MSIALSQQAARFVASGLLSALQLGGGPARAQIYGAPRPAAGASPGAAVLLADAPLASPAGTVQATGELMLHPGVSAPILADGVAPAWARLVTLDGSFVADLGARLAGAAPTPGDPEELVITAAALTVGGLLRVEGGTLGAAGVAAV